MAPWRVLGIDEFKVYAMRKNRRRDKTMPYRAAKISFDGSHYIATPKENFPQGHKRRRAARLLSVEEVEKKEQFEAAYKESQQLPKKERKNSKDSLRK